MFSVPVPYESMTCSITRSRSQVASLLRLPDSHSIHTCRSAPGRAIPHSSRRIARFRCFHTVLPHASTRVAVLRDVRSLTRLGALPGSGAFTVLPHAYRTRCTWAGSTVRSPRETLTQNDQEYSASPDVRAQGAARLTGKSELPCWPQGSDTGKITHVMSWTRDT